MAMANIPIDTKGATTYFQGNTWPPGDPAERVSGERLAGNKTSLWRTNVIW